MAALEWGVRRAHPDRHELAAREADDDPQHRQQLRKRSSSWSCRGPRFSEATHCTSRWQAAAEEAIGLTGLRCRLAGCQATPAGIMRDDELVVRRVDPKSLGGSTCTEQQQQLEPPPDRCAWALGHPTAFEPAAYLYWSVIRHHAVRRAPSLDDAQARGAGLGGKAQS